MKYTFQYKYTYQYQCRVCDFVNSRRTKTEPNRIHRRIITFLFRLRSDNTTTMSARRTRRYRNTRYRSVRFSYHRQSLKTKSPLELSANRILKVTSSQRNPRLPVPSIGISFTLVLFHFLVRILQIFPIQSFRLDRWSERLCRNSNSFVRFEQTWSAVSPYAALITLSPIRPPLDNPRCEV